MIRVFVEKYRPTVGFSLAEAAQAQRVTVIGSEKAFSAATLQKLPAARWSASAKMAQKLQRNLLTCERCLMSIEKLSSPQAATSDSPTRPSVHKPVIKVVGMGGGGSNAVNRMIELGLSGVEFVAANTDCQALKHSLAPLKIQLGPQLTRGLGAGGKPEIGKAAALESYRELEQALQGADMVFLTAGMGGGTGSGSIGVAARIARHLGAVTIAIVTTPFAFEAGRRQANARQGLEALRPNTDTLIAIPNDRLLYVAPRDLSLDMAFRLADDVLRQAVQGITELITETGLINVDFAHVRRVMKLGGGALMAIGQGQGANKARQALEQALHHPLLESTSLDNAAGILINFTGGSDLSLFEISEAVSYLRNQANPDAEIAMGVTTAECFDNRAQVILIVTGLGSPTLEETLPGMRLGAAVAPRHGEMESAVVLTQAMAVEAATPNQLDLPAFMRRRS